MHDLEHFEGGREAHVDMRSACGVCLDERFKESDIILGLRAGQVNNRKIGIGGTEFWPLDSTVSSKKLQDVPGNESDVDE